MNQTSDSLQVECTESFDGGLPQSFFMEILELPTLKSKFNTTTTKTPPIFYADGLEAGANYRIMLYAVNAKGKSDPTIIDTVTFKGVAKFTGEFNNNQLKLFERSLKFKPLSLPNNQIRVTQICVIRYSLFVIIITIYA